MPSRWPNSRLMVANIVSRSVRLLTSARTTRLPAPSVSLAARSDPSFKPQMATRAPSLSNSCAAASPIPLLPPVMRMFLSASLPIASSLDQMVTGCAPPGRSGSCDPSASPSPAEGLVDCDERDCGILLALHQLVLGRVDGALRVEDREEVLQTARVPVGGQLERAAVRGDGSAQRIAPPQLAPVGRERVLDLFERGEDGLLILEERLFLPRLLHPDVRPDASARED